MGTIGYWLGYALTGSCADFLAGLFEGGPIFHNRNNFHRANLYMAKFSFMASK